MTYFEESERVLTRLERSTTAEQLWRQRLAEIARQDRPTVTKPRRAGAPRPFARPRAA